ncbi:chromosome segregation protein SMC [Paractinoplanes rishiriensis]|uniref:Chromosome segregation protein SMC n=2 Tax=Paractinoplanes rishiriensis TaxID=1050105 RepID=A0A919KAJ6_9ACTN|nr:chromosome segregation protein SMC [Actinoplanes rishiriensis]
MFSIIPERQKILLKDFHVPPSENPAEPPRERQLYIETYLSFPELKEDAESGSSVAEFFQHMSATDQGAMVCRLRLEATWTDDGSVDGVIDDLFMAVTSLDEDFNAEDQHIIRQIDRKRIQMVYVPAVRDGSTQMTAFLRGRLWRAMNWSDKAREALQKAGSDLRTAFLAEPGVERVAKAAARRWRDLYSGGTFSTPTIAPIDTRFDEFVRNVGVEFSPDESGRAQDLAQLSDGQRSLFHLSMTAATLDVESSLRGSEQLVFDADKMALPALTLIAVEEPENNLSPFYLSRIVRQIEGLTAEGKAQAVLSSHSASILARVQPEQVRHFRLETASRATQVREITLPAESEAAAKYVREAVRTFPELYFASYVVLGEGSSEEVVIPRIAEAMQVPIDRSFVAVVPLGGRHVNHLWRLLSDLQIPHATLLDLDRGRDGGGWGRVKTTCEQLIASNISASEIAGYEVSPESLIDSIQECQREAREEDLNRWLSRLRVFDVYFCEPLDLDMTMFESFSEAYKVLEPGRTGPSDTDGDSASKAVLGQRGDASFYGESWLDRFLWYRYLFLGRGKPTTHVRVLSGIDNEDLSKQAPEVLRSLIGSVQKSILTVNTSGVAK